jgi:poly-gamma-glutamate capsule biosynthesis protein CapA/YwtB (metallophosphatase superfamily)
VSRRPLIVVLGLLVLAIAIPVTGNELGFGATAPSSSPRVVALAPSAAPPTLPSSGATDPPVVNGGASGAAATPSPATADPAPAIGPVAVVPVAQFRTTRTSTTLKEVKAVLAGTSSRYDAIELVKGETGPILTALGVDRPAKASRLVEAKDAKTLMADLASHRGRLGFLRADAVGPGVRALTWKGKSLFGDDRVAKVADWPLTAALPPASAGRAFDPAATWTLVAGGDIMLDRGVYETLVKKGKGANFMFDGGTAQITSRVCCSSFGWKVPRTQRTGDKGAVRSLFKGADIALANFENPAPNAFHWHKSGTIFSADPALIDGIKAAGFDVMGTANNHIRDQGATGLLQTLKNLRARGLKTAGSGKDLATARKPAIIDTHGVKVAILAYDAIAPSYHATATKVGSAPMTAKVVTADVKAARAAGADVVIVFPHWGTEYRAKPNPGQVTLAHQILDAGADMIIGNHPHWTQAMETYKGKPIWYALGNLVFDQTWSEETMEGMTLELTFAGKRLAQVRIRPHVLLDKAQPNFLDPAGSGKIVMDRVFKNSPKLAW